MSGAALTVEGLSVMLGAGGRARRLVDGVSFSILPGESVGLVGESGCGKTMTAMAILGLLPANARIECRRLELNGTDISSLGAARRRALLGREMAMVFQQPATALDPVFTLGQQIGAVHRRHAKTGRSQARKAVLEVLGSVGFEDPGDIAAAYPHQLSGGMRQLAMIAMATVCKPSVIIADEPTTALDSTTRTLILQQLARLQTRHNIAVLLISHDLNVVRRVCARVMVMYCGRVVESASCAALFAAPRHPYSAGLLACIPSLDDGPAAEICPIPGQVPPAAELPPGCHFAPRCERAEARCLASVPTIDAGSRQAAACYRPLP